MIETDLQRLENDIERFLGLTAEQVREKMEERFHRVGDVRVIFIPRRRIYSKTEIEGASLHT